MVGPSKPPGIKVSKLASNASQPRGIKQSRSREKREVKDLATIEVQEKALEQELKQLEKRESPRKEIKIHFYEPVHTQKECGRSSARVLPPPPMIEPLPMIQLTTLEPLQVPSQ